MVEPTVARRVSSADRENRGLHVQKKSNNTHHQQDINKEAENEDTIKAKLIIVSE